MSSLKIGIIIYAIFCLGLQLNAEERIKTDHKYFPNAKIIFDPLNYYLAPNYIFAACYNEKADDKQINCTLVSSKFHDQYTCNTTVKPKFDGPMSALFFMPLNKEANKAILDVQEVSRNKKTVHRLIIVDFHENSCSTKETTVIVDNKYVRDVNILPYGDKFDVIYENSAQCGDKNLCRIRIDTNNLSFENLSHWVIPDGLEVKSLWTYLSPVEYGFFHQSSTGYLSFRTDGDGLAMHNIINIVNNQGEIKVIKKIDIDRKKLHTSSLGFSSVNNGTIEIAFINYLESLNTTEINFLHFDQDGKSISEQLVKVKNHRFQDIFKHDLKDGGFLIATIENHHTDHEQYHIIKFDDKANKIGSVELKGFTCDGNGRTKYLKFFDNDTCKTCVLMVCFDMLDAAEIELGHVDSYLMCLKETDFII